MLPILGQLFLSLTSTPLLLSTALELFINTIVSPYPLGIWIFQYPQCMPKTAGGTKPCIDYVFVFSSVYWESIIYSTDMLDKWMIQVLGEV